MGCLSLKGGALLIGSNVLIQDKRSMVTTMARTTKNAMDVTTKKEIMLCDKFAAIERDDDLALSDPRSDQDPRVLQLSSTKVVCVEEAGSLGEGVHCSMILFLEFVCTAELVF